MSSLTLSLQQERAWSQINQRQQMPTAASRTCCERQAENPLAQMTDAIRP